MTIREETKQDIKENVIGLTQHAKEVGQEKAAQVSDYVREQAANLRLSGADAVTRAENRIRKNPGQSVGIAFAAGIVASYLMRRKAA